MTIVNIHEAKTQFSKLVNRALNGEDIVIARGGRPLLRLTPYVEQISSPRIGGQLKGLITIADDFDAPLPAEYLKLFYGTDERENEENHGEKDA